MDIKPAQGNVRRNTLPNRNDLRSAVATIVRSVQLEMNLTDEALAEEIGISESTIRNACNQKNDLGTLALIKIGAAFGEERLQPLADLFDGMLSPRYASTVDAIPSLARCIADVSVAHSPKQRRDALPVMRLARDVLNNLITCTEQGA